MKNALLVTFCFIGFFQLSNTLADNPCTFQNVDGTQSVTLECSDSMNINNDQCVYNSIQERVDCNNDHQTTSDFEFNPFSSMQIKQCTQTGGYDDGIPRVTYDVMGDDGYGLLCGETSDGLTVRNKK